MSMRDAIVAVFERVAADQGRKLAPISDGLRLTNSGLDSLSFAVIVATLEDSHGLDPFTAPEWTDFPVTFGDFVKLYDQPTVR